MVASFALGDREAMKRAFVRLLEIPSLAGEHRGWLQEARWLVFWLLHAPGLAKKEFDAGLGRRLLGEIASCADSCQLCNACALRKGHERDAA